MATLRGARLAAADRNKLEIALDGGYRLLAFFLDAYLARILIIRPPGLRMDRGWSLSRELSGQSDDGRAEPNEGRARLDVAGFPGVAFQLSETATAILAETDTIKLEICRSPLALRWQVRQAGGCRFTTMLEDRATGAYRFEQNTARLFHFLKRDPLERYYGFGEKSGDADKHGRRIRMGTADALGYDARTSDPLYKHIPFYISVRPDRGGEAVGLFYDNLARGAFDLGQEIDAYHGPFRSFEADDGDLDLYVIFGGSIGEIVASYSALTGPMAFPPRWTLGYSGSAMPYTDAPDAPARLETFLDLTSEHAIPCQSFHLSSGYTLRDGKRYVFTWDEDRFPSPKAFTEAFAKAGVRLIANVKPAMLLDHPRFDEVESFRGFIRDSEDKSRPYMGHFWGGDAAFLDFTNPRTRAWWSSQITEHLLDKGIASTWNDNNEFEIWDGEAAVDLDGRGGTIACLRPVQTALMLRASMLAQIAHAPEKRPFLVSRSGGPGMQRYAQTWTGDNRSDWKSLRYNLRMGHGLSLSGLFNFGHDVGGFAGPRPDPELFMRWIEQGIYWPRFTIHSWNDDGSASEPWMYPEILPLVQAAMLRRERFIPLLYSLLWRAHAHHEPILRPVFFDFPNQPESYAENDCFMLGPRVLVAPVLDPGIEERSVWLPEVAGGWYDFRTGEPWQGGRHIQALAPLGFAPAYIRAGSVLPLGPAPSWAAGPLTLRLFPAEGLEGTFELYDDDGESAVSRSQAPCLIHVEAAWAEGRARLRLSRRGSHSPRWTQIRFEDRTGAAILVCANGKEDVGSLPIQELHAGESSRRVPRGSPLSHHKK